MRHSILLACANANVSSAICSTLLMHPNYKVVHICDSCAQAKDYILKYSPNIAFLDQSLNNKCGIQLAKDLRDLGSATKIAIHTSSFNKKLLLAAIEYGVLGYFSKNIIRKQLFDCLENITNNRYFIEKELFAKDSNKRKYVLKNR